MQLRKIGLVALTIVLGLFSLSPATATTTALERFGNVYAMSVCGKYAPNIGSARCFAKVVTDARGNIRDGKPNLGRNVAPSGYGPADLKLAYNITSGGTSAFTIAIVDAYGYHNAEADLAVYRSQFGFRRAPRRTAASRRSTRAAAGQLPPHGYRLGPGDRADLDMVSAMCPNCKIILVEANSATLANLGGGGEHGCEPRRESDQQQLWRRRDRHRPATRAPTTAGHRDHCQLGRQRLWRAVPGGLAARHCGGRHRLSRASNSRGWSETVWNGAGSGCSAVYAKPSWQTDRPVRRRTVADVSAVADPSTGVAVYGPSTRSVRGWMVFGGTSVAAPLIAGVYGVNGSRSLTLSDPYAHTSSLFDITSGSNGTAAVVPLHRASATTVRRASAHRMAQRLSNR